MFEKIRKPSKVRKSRIKSVIAYVIFGSICIVFVFLGVPSGQLFTGGSYVAIVNNEIISIAQFQKALEQMRSKQNPSKISNAQSQKKEQQRVIDSLIEEELVYQNAKDMGLYVSDGELKDQITSFPAFQEEGHFKNSLYSSYLKSQRTSAEYFETQIRKWILTSKIKKLFNYVFESSLIENEKKDLLDQYEFKLKYVRISLSDSASSSSKDEIVRWENLLQDSSQLEKEFKAQNLVWVKLSPVTLKNWKGFISGFEDYHSLFDQVLSIYPQTGIIPKLYSLRTGDLLITYLEKVEKKKASNEKLPDWMQNFPFLSHNIYSSWLKNIRKTSKVLVNDRYYLTDEISK